MNFNYETFVIYIKVKTILAIRDRIWSLLIYLFACLFIYVFACLFISVFVYSLCMFVWSFGWLFACSYVWYGHLIVYFGVGFSVWFIVCWLFCFFVCFAFVFCLYVCLLACLFLVGDNKRVGLLCWKKIIQLTNSGNTVKYI